MEDPTRDVPVPGPAERAPSDGATPGRWAAAREQVGRAWRRAAPRLRAARTWQPRHGWWAAIGLVVAGAVASLVLGVTTASVQGALGPHVTRYDVTTDATVTIDFGPLGTLQIDSPLPLTLGVRATVQEIPASVTELGEARTLQALSEDLTAYVSFFSGPAAAVRDVAYGLVGDALLRAGVTFVLLVAGWWAVRLLLGADRRRELVAALAARARPVTAGALALVVGATVLTSSVAPGDRPAPAHLSSVVFDGTPLEGARVTGRLGGVIDTYGAYAVDAWRENERFYRSADDALVVAWQAWEEGEERAAQEAAQRAAAARLAAARAERERAAQERAAQTDAASTEGTDGDAGDADDADAGTPHGADDADDGGATTGATPTGTPTGTPGVTPTASPTVTPAPSPTPEVDPIVLVVVSDLHCNVGMAPLIGTLARLAKADVVLDAGDTTMNGTSVEQYCVTSFARAVPAGVALVTSPGNHDSRETSANYARAGATVLDGGVVEVAGVRILGDHDPNETRVGGGGTAAAADETPSEAGRRLADVACDDGAVDLLLVHTPTVGDAALDDGCVPAQVSGHYHRRVGPEQVGLGIRYVSSSTAGATLNQPTVGPLRGVAELTVLRFDPASRRVVSYQVVQVAPDTTVTVGRPQAWPLVVEPQDDADEAGTGDDEGAGDGAGSGDGADAPQGTGDDGAVTRREDGTGDGVPPAGGAGADGQGG